MKRAIFLDNKSPAHSFKLNQMGNFMKQDILENAKVAKAFLRQFNFSLPWISLRNRLGMVECFSKNDRMIRETILFQG